MIPQYTAASIVSINKQFANPASTDSITSSNGQEDHVSMGANSALQLYKIIENVRNPRTAKFRFGTILTISEEPITAPIVNAKL